MTTRIDEGFEQLSSNGVQCLKCGATVQPIGELTRRHRAWHEALEKVLDPYAMATAVDKVTKFSGI